MIALRDGTPTTLPQLPEEGRELTRVLRLMGDAWAAHLDESPVPPHHAPRAGERIQDSELKRLFMLCLQDGTEMPKLPEEERELNRVLRVLQDACADRLAGKPVPPIRRTRTRGTPRAPKNPTLDLSLTFDMIRGKIPGTVDRQVDISLGLVGVRDEPNKYIHAIIRHSREREICQRLIEQKAKMKNKVVPQCKFEGCDKPVDSHFYKDRLCYLHGDKEKLKCKMCKERVACKAGKLCRRCFTNANDNKAVSGDQKGWCSVCSTREIVYRSRHGGGGRCLYCIDAKRPGWRLIRAQKEAEERMQDAKREEKYNVG